MTLFKNKYRIESNRLSGYDYSSIGYYFITICTKNRENLFGEIIDNKMRLSAFGQLVKYCWRQTSKIRKNIKLDAFIIMPNHLHGIIVITRELPPINSAVEIDCNQSLRGKTRIHRYGPQSNNLFAVIRGFKSIVTKKINIIRQMPGMPVWQSNYYDYIIRDENDLNRIREYIRSNPERWGHDRNNLKN